MRPEATAATTGELLQVLLDAAAPAPELVEVGRVVEVGDGIAFVSGLARALADELLEFASGASGIVFDLDPEQLGVVLLDSSARVHAGEDVRRTERVVSVPVGASLLGRVVDPLGNPLDGKGVIDNASLQPIEAEARGILERRAVTQPLRTGLRVIDAAVPVGLGQRQLIIGDRQTGKTSIAIDAILNQAGSDMLCIYCAIGQRGDAVARAISALGNGGVRDRTVVVTAGNEDAPGLAWIAPYAAMSIAESLADEGHDVLLVLDDLTRHAQAYRELSLLLRRPPGREAFPGDIFHVHARLLERAGRFTEATGGGSITALPVVETQAGNLSAFIPTNLISITDGQIYLSPHLVQKNQFPAVDLGVSVSRVGAKAQSRTLREIAGNLRVTLSQFEELEAFARFGTRLDDATRARLARGSAVRSALRQPERAPMPADEQLGVLVCAMEGLFDDMDEREIDGAITAISVAIRERRIAIADILNADARLGAEDRAHIVDGGRTALATLAAEVPISGACT